MSNAVAKQDQEVNPVTLAWEHYSIALDSGQGRPTKYNAETAAAIISELHAGVTVTALCKQHDKPGINTFYVWMHRYPEFQEAVNRARGMQSHTFADMALEAPTDALASLVGDKSDNARVQAYRLKADILRWRAGVQNKEYADKQTVTHTVDTDTAKLLLEARNRIKHLDGECKRVED